MALTFYLWCGSIRGFHLWRYDYFSQVHNSSTVFCSGFHFKKWHKTKHIIESKILQTFLYLLSLNFGFDHRWLFLDHLFSLNSSSSLLSSRPLRLPQLKFFRQILWKSLWDYTMNRFVRTAPTSSSITWSTSSKTTLSPLSISTSYLGVMLGSDPTIRSIVRSYNPQFSLCFFSFFQNYWIEAIYFILFTCVFIVLSCAYLLVKLSWKWYNYIKIWYFPSIKIIVLLSVQKAKAWIYFFVMIAARSVRVLIEHGGSLCDRWMAWAGKELFSIVKQEREIKQIFQED